MPDFTRKTLYDLVWTTPTSRLALDYAMSDVGLVKLCRRYDIPTPPRGYWARLQVGQKVERPSLPSTHANNIVVASIPLRSEVTSKPDPPIAASVQATDIFAVVQEVQYPELGPPPTFPDDLESIRERWSAVVRRVPTPKLGPRRHPAIEKVLGEDLIRATERKQDFWRRPEGPRFRSPLQQRRLRILNALFLALQDAGATCAFGDDWTWQADVTVEGTVVPFYLHAPGEFRRGQKVRQSPTQLELRVGTAETIRDAKAVWNERKVTLDEQMVDVVVGILTAAEVFRRENAVKDYKARVRAHEHELWEQEQLRRRRERDRREVLVAEAEAYRIATGIRTLVAAVRSSGRFRGEQLSLEEMATWVTWALAAADRLDPLTSNSATRSTSLRPDRWGDW